MFTFEVKPKDSIYFGDLEDLMLHKNSDCGLETTANICSYDRTGFYHGVSSGNYVVSSIDSSLNPQIILHHENVSPQLIAEKLSQIEEDQRQNFEINHRPPSAKRSRLSVETENVQIDEEKWRLFRAQQTWPDYMRKFTLDDYRQHLVYCIDGAVQGQICRLCQQLVMSDASTLQFSEWQMNLFWKIFKAHEKVRDFEIAKSLKLSQLFFFVNDVSWLGSNFEKSDLRVTLVSSLVCKLEANGRAIGLVINASKVLRSGEMRCSSFRDRTCFAWTIFDYCNCRISGAHDYYLLSKEAVLHKNEYRCFYKSGQCEENDFYGATGSICVDRLPDSILVKILSYLPWKEQARCRRVGVRWAKASDSALAVDIKNFGTSCGKIRSMGIDNLKRLIPLAANHLESIYVSQSHLDYQYFDKCISENLESISSFRSLRDLVIDDRLLGDFFGLFSILDKCPNLKNLAVEKSYGIWASVTDEPRKTYNLEKISFACSTDFELSTVANYFPRLTWIKLVTYRLNWLSTDGITNDGLSAFVERFGDTLRRLEIEDRHSRNLVGAFTGIGQCRNLEYLSVSRSNIVSDGFLKAVSTGCLNLTTLIMERMEGVTNDGLQSLASLPKLTRLNINYAKGGISDGIMRIALEGHLEQLLAKDVNLSAACLKACVRYCPQLRLLDGCDNLDNVDDALEIARQYGRSGHSPILVLRSTNEIWHDDRINEVRNQIKGGNLGRRNRLIIEETNSLEEFLDNDAFDAFYSEENWESDQDSDGEQSDQDEDEEDEEDDEEEEELEEEEEEEEVEEVEEEEEIEDDSADDHPCYGDIWGKIDWTKPPSPFNDEEYNAHVEAMSLEQDIRENRENSSSEDDVADAEIDECSRLYNFDIRAFDKDLLFDEKYALAHLIETLVVMQSELELHYD